MTKKTPLNLLVIYGLIGLVIAGGVVTFAEVTSKVIPVFPRTGQLTIDLVLTSTLEGQLDLSPGLPGYSLMASRGNDVQGFSLNLTTQTVMVYRTGALNLSGSWIIIPETSYRGVSLQTGQRLRLGSLALPEGNITMVRVKVLDATVERGPGSSWEDIPAASSTFDLPARVQVRAHQTSNVILNFHLSCPALASPDDSHSHLPRSWCNIRPSAEDED